MEVTMNIPVVWAIIEKEVDGETYILLQTRWKPGTEYHGTFETPVWRMEKRENVFLWLAREIKEECGMDVEEINQQTTYIGKNSIGFTPFYCTQQLWVWLPWVMFWFVCRCSWELKHQEEETRNPERVNIAWLKDILKGDNVFDLQKPFLQFYLNNYESLSFQSYPIVRL